MIRATLRSLGSLSFLAFVMLTSASAACALRDDAQQRHAPRFEWPARGAIVFECWTEDPERLTIATRDGADVRAVGAGEALFAGSWGKFSELILIRHPGGFVSAYYGDIGELRVKRFDHVDAGQVIAAMRAGDPDEAPELRFELRAGGAVVNPRLYLDSSGP